MRTDVGTLSRLPSGTGRGFLKGISAYIDIRIKLLSPNAAQQESKVQISICMIDYYKNYPPRPSLFLLLLSRPPFHAFRGLRFGLILARILRIGNRDRLVRIDIHFLYLVVHGCPWNFIRYPSCRLYVEFVLDFLCRVLVLCLAFFKVLFGKPKGRGPG